MRVGDIVKKTNSYWFGSLGETDETIGNLFIITEAERTQGKWGYAIVDLNDFKDESAWWHDNQLEFVRDGYDKEYQKFLDFDDNEEDDD
ncbi:MAG: hypothetical protein WC554_09265 [Clostridia bacterium]